LFHYRNKVPQFSSNLGKREGDGKPAKGGDFWDRVLALRR
jgi:hypothetical protein